MDYLDSEHLDQERRAALLTACRDSNHQQLLRLLFSPPGYRSAKTERVPDYGAGRTLTLGERKSLARRPSRKVLERVMADPHPSVIRNLLRNPKLTEADVMRIVSRRPNYDKVLIEVYKNPRWNKRYPIKHALVCNPYSPPSLSIKLLPQLMCQDLSEILQDRGLHPSVLVSCRRLLEGEVELELEESLNTSDDDTPTLH